MDSPDDCNEIYSYFSFGYVKMLKMLLEASQDIANKNNDNRRLWMRKTLVFLALASTCSLYAASMGLEDLANPWYGSVGTGINNANPSEWDTPAEAYNKNKTNRGFYTFEIGKQVQHYVDVSLMYLNHETFNYQMYQQRIASSHKLENTEQTKPFNLNNRALLVSGFLHPDHNWYKISTVGLSPFIGGGIGYALNQIDNFYSTSGKGLNKAAVHSNSSMVNQVNINSFAWQASAGLSIHPITHLSLDVGYRYYDGGNLETANNVTNSSPANNNLITPWSGHLSMNQLFVDFKYKM